SNLPGDGVRTNPQGLLVALHYGYPNRIWSDRLYSNFELATLSLTYEKESGLWPFTKNKELIKSFMLEFRLSRIWGKGIEVSQDQVSPETWDRAMQEGRRPTVDWDHYQIGLIPYYRFYYPLNKEIRLYFEAGLGLALLNKPLIEDGTTWNFLFSGGFGLDCKFKTPFYTFLKLEHFSNGGQAWKGFTDNRVIGPENLVFGIGMRFPL
ncbi:MAG: acyloxyacyl hydrolase, partial [Deltaproteobacteria bacterium]|nr:acyloxyacyl hydrolase [Deltaproteobacteria bacterium]